MPVILDVGGAARSVSPIQHRPCFAAPCVQGGSTRAEAIVDGIAIVTQIQKRDLVQRHV